MAFIQCSRTKEQPAPSKPNVLLLTMQLLATSLPASLSWFPVTLSLHGGETSENERQMSVSTGELFTWWQCFSFIAWNRTWSGDKTQPDPLGWLPTAGGGYSLERSKHRNDFKTKECKAKYSLIITHQGEQMAQVEHSRRRKPLAAGVNAQGPQKISSQLPLEAIMGKCGWNP